MAWLREQNLSADAVIDAVQFFLDGEGCNATFEGEYGNDEYHVFRVSFSDRPSVCLRVEHPRGHRVPGGEDERAICARLEGERRAYERLGAVDFHWSMRLFGASLGFDNPIGYPYMVLDFAGENRLRWSDESPGEPARSALLARLAGIQLQLIQRTLETREMTAYEFFKQKIECRLESIRQGNLPELVEQDVLDQLALLPEVLGDEKDNRQFAMEHGDLRAESIISGSHFNIEAIVDWGSAEMVPVAQAARFPPLLSCCESADDSPSGQMLRDRAAYTAAVACAAARPQPALPYPGEGYEDGSRAAALAAMRHAVVAGRRGLGAAVRHAPRGLDGLAARGGRGGRAARAPPPPEGVGGDDDNIYSCYCDDADDYYSCYTT
ncbi:hypothetical protein ISF_07996 [Cordyceps fumosorosea ARSEF 2679]|uniref:Protein kinase-like domain protein n=1 Tax=Cordyceps fumosorosea (strain ARSEF 2679) TaxID=1081104 RepID=A0A162ID71_CORFA|nr:hypothetical protein ISF_07996 [Cordyceps fumosorosea ARSEF 2679]OAA55485.1 hypothetical protein ISF_07996 [Cordyceps fumosorosea ARSEF 2679]